MRALLLLALTACDRPSPVPEDTGSGSVTVDGADGTSATDGADGTAGEPDYTVYEGFFAQDVYGPGSDRPDLCQLVWLTVGRPASSTCEGCTWSFFITGTFDPALSDVGACGAQSNFSATWASDGASLFYEYGGGFVELAPVTGWSPDGDGYNFEALRSTEDDGYTTVLSASARVR